MDAYNLLYPVEIFRCFIIVMQVVTMILTWMNQKLYDFYLFSHPISWLNFFIIVSFSVFQNTYGQSLFLSFKDSDYSTLKDIYDEEIILEWYLVINAFCALLIAGVNFAILIRRESIGDENPPFYVADITDQIAPKNMTLLQL